MHIVHLTDPHLSTLDGVRFSQLRGKRLLGYQSWYRNRRHRHRSEALEAITADVRAQSPDLIVVTGDLVHIGLRSEFAEAREWLARLGPADRVRLIPGNHDCYHPESWALAREAYGDYLADVPGDASDHEPAAGFPGCEQYRDAVLVAASSAHPAPWWGAIGTLGEAQRSRINQHLMDNQQRFRVLAIHHPPLPGACSWRKALTDANDLQTILQHSPSHIVLHGHLHRNSSLTTDCGRIYCTASASSVHEHAPASYRSFRVEHRDKAWQVQMTLRSLGPQGVQEQAQEHYQLS